VVEDRVSVTEPELLDPVCNDQKETVLVEVVKLAQNPEVAVPTLVWLSRFDKCQWSGSDALYMSLYRGGFVRLCGVAGWIRSVPSRCLPIRFDQLPSQVVERGSQIVNNVTDGRTDAWRERSSRQGKCRPSWQS
jgi:hypothetical protein